MLRERERQIRKEGRVNQELTSIFAVTPVKGLQRSLYPGLLRSTTHYHPQQYSLYLPLLRLGVS